MKVELRHTLASLLADAAEIEHSLLCQYLFAAFSMKRRPQEGGVTWAQLELMRRWEASLLMIARQEMEHLGLVCNLLTAIGEAPHFNRPDYPIASIYFPVSDPPSLERFGLEQLRRFIEAERPYAPTAEEMRRVGYVFAARGAHAARALVDFKSAPPIGLLYAEIRSLFKQLAPSASLFIGPPAAQQTTLQIIPVPIRGLTIPADAPIYDVGIKAVTDLASALAAIDQIVIEGEGAPSGGGVSHFSLLVGIATELAHEIDIDPHFEPARPIMKDPTGVQITDPHSRAVYDLFEAAYETTIVLLMRYFAVTDETPSEMLGLQQAVFFPMMTTILRPLGEILTQLPVAPGSTQNAGPGFRFPRRLSFPPHRPAAWLLIDLEFQGMAAALDKIRTSGGYTGSIHDRLTLIYENMERIGWNFRQAMGTPSQS